MRRKTESGKVVSSHSSACGAELLLDERADRLAQLVVLLGEDEVLAAGLVVGLENVVGGRHAAQASGARPAKVNSRTSYFPLSAASADAARRGQCAVAGEAPPWPARWRPATPSMAGGGSARRAPSVSTGVAILRELRSSSAPVVHDARRCRPCASRPEEHAPAPGRCWPPGCPSSAAADRREQVSGRSAPARGRRGGRAAGRTAPGRRPCTRAVDAGRPRRTAHPAPGAPAARTATGTPRQRW